MRPLTTVKITIKNPKNPSFRRSTASSGLIKIIPRGAYIQVNVK